MKVVNIEEIGEQTEITVETGRWIFKRETKYKTTRRIAGEYYQWVQRPDNIKVPDGFSFQLDEWKRIGFECEA